MTSFYAALPFAAAALLAVWAIVASWRRYRDMALAHLAAARQFDPNRDFRVKVIAFGGPSALPAHPGVHRLPQRAAATPRRALSPRAPLRAAA